MHPRNKNDRSWEVRDWGTLTLTLTVTIYVALELQEREERCMAGLRERYRQHHADILHGDTPFDAVLAELTGQGDRSAHADTGDAGHGVDPEQYIQVGGQG